MTPQLRFHNLQEMPPGGFQYVIPELPAEHAKIGPVTSLQQCVSEAMQRYAANARLAPVDLRDKIEQANCERVPPGLCHYESNRQPTTEQTAFGIHPMTPGELLNGTATVGMWIVSGMKMVDQAAADKRAKTCASCTKYNRKPTGCSGCRLGQLLEVVTRFVGNRKTAADDLLQGCAICKCSQRVKVWAPISVITRFMSPEKLQEFPDWCWIRTESQ